MLSCRKATSGTEKSVGRPTIPALLWAMDERYMSVLYEAHEAAAPLPFTGVWKQNSAEYGSSLSVQVLARGMEGIRLMERMYSIVTRRTEHVRFAGARHRR